MRPGPTALALAFALVLPLTIASAQEHGAAVRPILTGMCTGSVAIVTSSDSVLSRWACGAVPAMQFVAARHHGRPVATEVIMPFEYRVAAIDSTPPPAYFEFQVEKPVRVIRTVHPHYPDDLRRARENGQVLVRFVVDTKGHAEPGSFTVIGSSDPRFTLAVRQAINATLYEPAQLGGRKVRQSVQQPFTFFLSRVDLSSP